MEPSAAGAVRARDEGISGRALLAAVLAASGATKLALARRFDGYLTGDDLEIIQAGLRSAVGFDYVPSSLRNLFHPVVLVGPFLRLGALFGPLSPELASFLAALPTILFSTLSVFLVYALARRLGLGENVARAAALLYGVHWMPWAYGATPYPRPISTAFFLGALLLVSGRDRPLLRGIAAGALVALACAVRFSEGVLLLPLLGFAWFRSRDPLVLAGVAVGFAAGGLLFLGLLDVLTWGKPFHSLREFVRIMFAGSPTPVASWIKPWYHYGKNVIRWISPVHLLLIAWGIRDRRLRLPLTIALTIVVLMSAFRYKQYRYLQAAIPFVAIAAAVGWDRLRAKAPRLAAAALVLAAGFGAVQTVRLLRDKSQSAVAAARYLAQRSPAPRVVALEQAWAYGERLYLGDAVVRDLLPARPLDAGAIREAVSGADAAAFYINDLDEATLRALSAGGMRPDRSFRRDGGKPVIVFLRPAR